MITETQILEAAKECGGFEGELGNHFPCFTPQELIKLAQHFYRQGLLDAAGKCHQYSEKTRVEYPEDPSSWVTADDLAEALSHMAYEVGK
jgi:hypothetical protein